MIDRRTDEMTRLAELLPAVKRAPGAPFEEPEERGCEMCGGAGRYEVPVKDEVLPRVVHCEVCLERTFPERKAAWISRSRLPARTATTSRFSTWQPRLNLTSALKAARDFAAQRTPAPHFLTLTGPVGTGKSHLEFAIGWEWLETGKGEVRYWQTEALLDELRRGYRGEGLATDDTYGLLDQVTLCPLLLLDDLGAHAQSGWAVAKLDQIIDARYENERWTVVTTNNPADLSERLQDRLRAGVCILMAGESHRRRAI